MSRLPIFTLKAVLDPRHNCPFASLIESETDVRVRARILTKVEHLRKIDPADYARPLVDTLEGPIKELRILATGHRVLFCTEQAHNFLLLFGGELKREGVVTPALIEAAEGMRNNWLAGGTAIDVDIPALTKKINGKRLGWPS